MLADNGYVLLSYDYGRGKIPDGGEVYLARFSAADVLAGEIITPTDGIDKGYLKRLIYKTGQSPVDNRNKKPDHIAGI